VRNGSVVDLQIAARPITALVSGSEIYEVKVEILPVASPAGNRSVKIARVRSIAGELLQGRLSKGVMNASASSRPGFPVAQRNQAIVQLPDWAEMCKQSRLFYGVGARLDQQPELLFRFAL